MKPRVSLGCLVVENHVAYIGLKYRVQRSDDSVILFLTLAAMRGARSCRAYVILLFSLGKALPSPVLPLLHHSSIEYPLRINSRKLGNIMQGLYLDLDDHVLSLGDPSAKPYNAVAQPPVLVKPGKYRYPIKLFAGEDNEQNTSCQMTTPGMRGTSVMVVMVVLAATVLEEVHVSESNQTKQMEEGEGGQGARA
ncbi:riboflavin biosynthesis protein RibD [Sesbania bispinosa]|nr:riboflavin biosynthesis protein RibD [Sesbania bispinosa]